MTQTQKTRERPLLIVETPRLVSTIFDASLRVRSGLSIALSDATVGVSLDMLGDWTITVGLSSRSARFHQITSSLESLGFFQATENNCTSYLFWTSLLSGVADVRSGAEQTLSKALKLLQAVSAPGYIG
jgi:hypothetical protein